MFIRSLLIFTLITLSQTLEVQAGGMLSSEVKLEGASKNVSRLQVAKDRIADIASGRPFCFGLPSVLEEPYRAFAKVAVHFQGDRVTDEVVEKNRDYWRTWNRLMKAVEGCEDPNLGDAILAATGLPLTPSVPDDLLEDQLGEQFEALIGAIMQKRLLESVDLDMRCAYLPPLLAFVNAKSLCIRPEIVALEGEHPRFTHLPHVFPKTLTSLFIAGPGRIDGPGYKHKEVSQLLPKDQRQLAFPLCLGELPLRVLAIQKVPMTLPEFLFTGLAPTLKELSLNVNPAKTPLPRSFSELIGLENLHLAHNDLAEVPSIAEFSKLSCLVVYERCMKKVEGLDAIEGSKIYLWRVLRPEKVTLGITTTMKVEEKLPVHFPSLPREQLWDYPTT
jgi:hypothetical protein